LLPVQLLIPEAPKQRMISPQGSYFFDCRIRQKVN